MKKPALLTATFLFFLAFVFVFQIPPKKKSLPNSEAKEQNLYPNDWMYNQRAYPNNVLNQKIYRDAVRQTLVAKAALNSRSGGDWTLAGPVNIGGRITDVALHPTDQNIIYAGASVGGIFKTTDGGENWVPIFEDQGVLTIGNIAISPSNPEVIYVGTGEANGSATSGAFFGNGIYKTTNGGTSWQNVGLDNSQHIGRIVIDPENPDRVFVAAAGLLYGKSEDKGLYRTLDGGQNWERVLFVSDSTSCIDVALNPRNPDTLFAATWERIRFPWQRRYGGVTSGLYRSTDGGDTWEQLTNGLPPSDEERGRIGVAVSPSNPEIIYTIFSTNSISNVFDGVYKSIDGGDSWFRVDNDGNINNVYANFGWFFGNIRVDPNNSEVVYALGLLLYQSTDGGVNWTALNANMHVDQHGLEVHPQNSDLLVAGNDGGIYISQQGGSNWKHVEVFPITQFYKCEIDFSQPDQIYGGSQDNGTLRTLTGEVDDWARILGGDGFHVIVDPTNNDIVYAESQFGRLFKSIDGGSVFSPTPNIVGIDPFDRNNWNTPVVIDPSNSSVLYYGTNKLYRSTDRAESWQPISDDLTDGEPPGGSSTFGTISSIAVAPTNPQVIYVGTDDGNVQVTMDGGNSWQNISAGIPDRYVTQVAVDPEDDSIAFATLSGYRYVDYQAHVLLTNDGGETWEDISGNLPEIPVNDIIVDPDIAGRLYIANDLGVWFTDDLGQNWEILGTNLPMTVVNDLDFQPQPRFLLAATFGRSIQKYDLGELTAVAEVNQPRPKVDLTVFPNPVQDIANIQFKLPEKQLGSLEVFSGNGLKIATITRQSFPKGVNEFSWNTSHLPAGSYLVRLYTKDRILTKKLLK